MKTKPVFYAMIVIFVVLISYFLIPSFDKRALFPFIALLGLLFLILGIVLVYMALQLEGRQRKFFLLTGISAICPFVFTILHNLFYGLRMISEGVIVLKYIFGFLHVVSFLIALLIAPIGFLIGVVISIYLMKKKVIS